MISALKIAAPSRTCFHCSHFFIIHIHLRSFIPILSTQSTLSDLTLSDSTLLSLYCHRKFSLPISLLNLGGMWKKRRVSLNLILILWNEMLFAFSCVFFSLTMFDSLFMLHFMFLLILLLSCSPL